MHYGIIFRTVNKSSLTRSKRQTRITLLLISLIFLMIAAYNTLSVLGAFEPPVYREDIPKDIAEQIPPEKLAELPSRNSTPRLVTALRDSLARL